MDKYTTLLNENYVNMLQIRRSSVNFVNLDFSTCVNVGQTLLNLFIDSNRVIACSKSSSVRSDVYLVVQGFTILFTWSVATLFEARLSFSIFFVHYTTLSARKICYSISTETFDTIVASQLLPFRSYFRSDTTFHFFLGKSKVLRICNHFQILELVYITEFVEEVLVPLQH